jgi:spore maturation protein CgeB
MRILIVDTYYPSFLQSFRKIHKGLFRLSYERYKKELLKTAFGTSDFYSYNLKKLGWEASEIITNDEILQNKWAKENGLKVGGNHFITKLQALPFAYKFLGRPKWVQEIALAQIKKYKPDIVYIQDLSILNPETLRKVKTCCRLLVGQIASPLPPRQYLKPFDLIVTSLPHYMSILRKMRIKSEYLKLAFDPRILKKVGKKKRIYNMTFVGSFTPYHSAGTKILEGLAKHVPVHVWGQGLEFLSPLSHLRKNYHGEAWGFEMYKILAKSKIVINRHISVSDGYANNMRLYEATGMGAMLITDRKKNLGELFKIGKEVVDYKNSADLVKKIGYYLKNETKREKIARSGQKRTLKDNTYRFRMRELVRILKKYV